MHSLLIFPVVTADMGLLVPSRGRGITFLTWVA